MFSYTEGLHKDALDTQTAQQRMEQKQDQMLAVLGNMNEELRFLNTNVVQLNQRVTNVEKHCKALLFAMSIFTSSKTNSCS